ncbi:ComF family protein [Staphylococcus caprae]|uniref:ComF family protein n=1 Tax=Staphylococcus caprae TaxID=29380 RepID=UPI000E687C3C|nr:ComF family protein [Staphylococcus caprae]MBU5271619.1 ComF family protein [Staphylococcus caprae]MDK6296743.1 ComF family protein [Staphylococcus caprae]MDK7232078.1 ComF family protein [Staphylococcus caprae]RIM36442.1 ComF family protein [Staphylococcus caprae]
MSRCLQCMNPIHDVLHIYNFFKPPRQFCEECEKKWAAIKLLNDDEERCARCLNLKTTDTQVCLDCQFLENDFHLMEQLYCDYKYQGIMKETIHQYKFMRDYELSKVLAQKLKLPRTDYDMIVPIPSPYERDVERTFNPVATVLDKMGVKYVNILGTNLRPKQSKLGKLERAQAMNPFYIKDEKMDLSDKVILLIDDIYTTGLTIHHAGCKLSALNVRKFKVFAFAR